MKYLRELLVSLLHHNFGVSIDGLHIGRACSSHGTMPNTHSRVSLIPAREASAIDVPWRKLSALVLYSQKDIDKILHTR